MDIDAFIAVHRAEWDRLDHLARRIRLSGEETDELLELYQRASTHLSMLQAVEPDSPVAAQLSVHIGRARTHFTSAGQNAVTAVGYFFVHTLPVAFYRLRWLTLAVGSAFVVLAVAAGYWTYHHPQIDLLMPEDQRVEYAQESFVSYYSEHPSSSFASQVWTNNAWIAAQCVAFGVTGVWPVFILGLNAISVGMAGGVMHEQGAAADFWLNILPHGMMEITAIFVAGAAGLRILWAWVAPGRQRRGAALAQEARRLITVAIGLTLVLLVSGIVEGYVTPAPWPDAVRLGIGALVLAGYWTYALVLGSRAAAAGVTGDLDQFDAGTYQLSS